MKLAERIAEELNEGNYLVVTGKEPISVDPIGEAESIIAAHLEPVLNCLLAYKVHTLRGDHGKAARAVLDALALLDTSVPVTASEGDKRQD